MGNFETSIVPLAPWIYAIDQQMVRSFVLVGTQRALCLDAGVCPADFPALIRQVTDLPVQMVLSHSDHDHTANLGQFPEAWCHEEELPLLKEDPSARSLCFHTLREGDTIDLGGHRLRVLFLPGHTPGSIGLLEEAEGILFSGDTVSCGPVYMFGAHRLWNSYLPTLRRLRRMAEDSVFSAVYPCHNTCHLDSGAIGHLIRCAEGIDNGTLTGVPANLPHPDAKDVLLYTDGPCGIYR